MIFLFRKLSALILVAGLVAPVMAAVCAATGDQGCGKSSHACCEGPRIAQCNCGADQASGREAEPAQRGPSAPDATSAVLLAHDALPSAAALPCRVVELPPPVAERDRLTLFSILLV